MNIILKGIGAGPGKGSGKVKVIKDVEDFSKFEEGNVLVTKMTDPSMVIIMGKASAAICDTGGLTSHAAIVSREMGIPCVVATENGTTVLKDGDVVEVDGTKGEVYSVD